MKPFSKLNAFFERLPVHLVIIFMCIIWIVPTVGTFVSSFRPRQEVNETGWWRVFLPEEITGVEEYDTYCQSCHGPEGQGVENVDLLSEQVLEQFSRSNRLLVFLRDPEQHPPIEDPALPDDPNEAIAILSPLLEEIQSTAAVEEQGRFTLRNYADALVGYKGTQSYLEDCEETGADELTRYDCNASDVLNQGGMGIAFLNTILVTIPATLLPILFAGFAAYAFSWMDFKGRLWLFALLVGLQIVPLQMVLVPISRLYRDIGLQSTFLGIWLFHTGFGLPYAIYLMRNFLGSLPKDLFESAYLDGANHWTAFWQLAIPLAMPAIASLAIFQFLWVWNDFLVATIFLNTNPVLTVQITNLIDPRGGNWHILTAAAFLSFIVPMGVFFAFQRYFVRGMLAGSVKG